MQTVPFFKKKLEDTEYSYRLYTVLDLLSLWRSFSIKFIWGVIMDDGRETDMGYQQEHTVTLSYKIQAPE